MTNFRALGLKVCFFIRVGIMHKWGRIKWCNNDKASENTEN